MNELRLAPAMAAGVPSKLWEMSELVRGIDELEGFANDCARVREFYTRHDGNRQLIDMPMWLDSCSATQYPCCVETL